MMSSYNQTTENWQFWTPLFWRRDPKFWTTTDDDIQK